MRDAAELRKHAEYHEGSAERDKELFVDLFLRERHDAVKTREDALEMLEEKVRDRITRIDEMKLITPKDVFEIAKSVFGGRKK